MKMEIKARKRTKKTIMPARRYLFASPLISIVLIGSLLRANASVCADDIRSGTGAPRKWFSLIRMLSIFTGSSYSLIEQSGLRSRFLDWCCLHSFPSTCLSNISNNPQRCTSVHFHKAMPRYYWQVCVLAWPCFPNILRHLYGLGWVFIFWFTIEKNWKTNIYTSQYWFPLFVCYLFLSGICNMILSVSTSTATE